MDLRRREDRFKYFLKDYPLDTKISKFEAIDGKTLLNIPNYFKDRLPGEVGCFLSHKSLWERTVKNEHCDLSLVFEDDVKFSTCFLEKFNCVLNELEEPENTFSDATVEVENAPPPLPDLLTTSSFVANNLHDDR